MKCRQLKGFRVYKAPVVLLTLHQLNLPYHQPSPGHLYRLPQTRPVLPSRWRPSSRARHGPCGAHVPCPRLSV